MFSFIKSIFIVILFLLIPFYSFSTNKIDINQATVEELEKLPGIGPKIAKNIVEYREKNGPFRSIEELLKVKGIGPKKLEQIKKYLKINKEKTNSPDISKEQEKSLEIYYYKDEKGIIHYTQFPETVPEKYRNTLKKLE